MRVFVTGATGFIGGFVVRELLASGHAVVGLTRSDAGEAALVAAGAEPYRGVLEDPDGVARGLNGADGVIHLAFDHDFSNFDANCDKDRRVIEALGAALAGSGRPLLVTSGTGLGSAEHGAVATEDVVNFDHPNPRVASERAVAALSARGVNVSTVRLPQVHDTTRQGLLTYAVARARETRVSAFVGDGANRFSAAHVGDVARLYRLALERGQAGARYHAVAEEGLAMREIATVIGERLGIPAASLTAEAAKAHFGWLAMFVTFDLPASSTRTRQALGWQPTGPGLIADLCAIEVGDAPPARP